MRMMKTLLAGLAIALAALPLAAEVKVEANPDGQTATVSVAYAAPDAKEVTVTGSFNGWNTTANPLEKQEDGRWTGSFKATLDELVQYKFMVDGAWTLDPEAPGLEADGHGGNNGMIDVALLLGRKTLAANAASAGAAVAKKPAMVPLSFGNYTVFSSDTVFLTKNLKTKNIDGYDFDAERLKLRSYWKLQGDVLPGVNLFTELTVADGSMTLVQVNPLAGETELTTVFDGGQSLAEGFFHPFTTFGKPSLGHLKVQLSSDYLRLTSAYNNAQSTGHAPLVFNTVNAANAGDGFLELGLGDALANGIPGAKLDVVLAPTSRGGKNGFYSWYNLGLGELGFDLVYSMQSSRPELWRFFEDWQGSAAAGAQLALGPFLLKAQGLADFGSPAAAADYDFLDHAALGLSARFEQAGSRAELRFRGAGARATSLFGDDGSLGRGALNLGLEDTVRLDAVQFGVDANLTANADLALIASSDWKLWTKPHAFVDLGAVLPLKLGVELYGSLQFDFPQAATFGFQLQDAGAKLQFGKLGEFITGANLWYNCSVKYQGYDQASAAYPLDMVFNSVMASLNFVEGMSANASVLVRSLVKDFGGDAQAAAAAQALQSPLGFSLAWSWILPLEELKRPTLYLSYLYNCDPYDSGMEGFKFADGRFRPENLEGSAAESHVRIGLRWSF